MVRYLTPQLKQTYDKVLRKLMPWRMIDALETLDEADSRAGEGVAGRAASEKPGETPEGQDGENSGTPST